MKQPWDAILWWEIRRIRYNLIVLVLGLISIATIEIIGSYFLKQGADAIEPMGLLLGVVIYAILANVYYTLGWLTELLWCWGNTSRTQDLRPKVFWLGTIFSGIITLLPAVIVPILWMIFGFGE